MRQNYIFFTFSLIFTDSCTLFVGCFILDCAAGCGVQNYKLREWLSSSSCRRLGEMMAPCDGSNTTLPLLNRVVDSGGRSEHLRSWLTFPFLLSGLAFCVLGPQLSDASNEATVFTCLITAAAPFTLLS